MERLSTGSTDGRDRALAMLASNEQSAFAELYERWYPRILTYTLARTGELQQASDLTAETFLLAFEAIGSYRGQGPFGAWLFAIARNLTNDYFREHRQWRSVPLTLADQVMDPAPLPERQVETGLELARVQRAMRMLTPDRARAVSLRFFLGLSTAAASQAMARSEAAVKMLVHRGLSDLRLQLAAADHQHGPDVERLSS